MGDHYFTSNPSVESNQRKIRFKLRGTDFLFTTDAGVFSKGDVDFGTRLLVESYIDPDIEGDLLDVGCGYGPIGISIAKTFPNRNIVMVDVNERALSLAEKSRKDNGVENITIKTSNLYENIKENRFAVILSNPPIRAGKKIVHQLLEEAFQYLIDKGELWIVIQKKQGAPSAIEKLESVFSTVEVMNKKKGYFIIKAKKN